MKNIGYSDDDLSLILSSYPIHTYDEATLLYLVKNLVLYFHRNTLSNEDIIRITTKIPSILTMSIENIKIRVNELLEYDFNKLEIFQMIKNYPYVIDMSIEKIKNKIQFLKDLGITSSQVVSLLLQRTSLLNQSNGIIHNRISFFQDFGYDMVEIISMIAARHELIDCQASSLLERIQEVKAFGLTDQEFIKLSVNLPDIFLFEREEIQAKIKLLEDCSLSPQVILFLIKKIPMIVKEQYLEKVKDNLENIERLGFSNQDIEKLILKNPYILLFDKDTISSNFKNFIHFSFYHKEVTQMVTATPLLLTYNKEEMKKRLQFFKKKDLLELVKEHSKLLLFPLELIEGRYERIEDGNYRDLYLSDILFYQKYHLKREEILGR